MDVNREVLFAVNAREQERKAMADEYSVATPSWAPPETLTAKLNRFLFQLQNTMTSLSEMQREAEKLRAGL